MAPQTPRPALSRAPDADLHPVSGRPLPTQVPGGVKEGKGVRCNNDKRFGGQRMPGDGSGLKIEGDELGREVGYQGQNEV